MVDSRRERRRVQLSSCSWGGSGREAGGREGREWGGEDRDLPCEKLVMQGVDANPRQREAIMDSPSDGVRRSFLHLCHVQVTRGHHETSASIGEAAQLQSGGDWRRGKNIWEEGKVLVKLLKR